MSSSSGVRQVVSSSLAPATKRSLLMKIGKLFLFFDYRKDDLYNLLLKISKKDTQYQNSKQARTSLHVQIPIDGYEAERGLLFFEQGLA